MYTDHKNLTYKTFNTERVMRWRLILEEYGPELIYIQGSQNTAADALSRLDIVDTPNPVQNNIKAVNEHYGLEDEDISHPTNYKTIMQNQQNNKDYLDVLVILSLWLQFILVKLD